MNALSKACKKTAESEQHYARKVCVCVCVSVRHHAVLPCVTEVYLDL